ncbi:MAG: lipocalin family protein [Chitinophagaceae bacterium]
MKKITTLFLLAASVISCKKPKKECSINTADLSGTYRFAAYTYKQSPTSTEQDYYTILFPNVCNRDDEVTFNANGTYQKADVGVVCNPPENDNGTWSVSGNNMTVDGEVLIVKSFDCNTLVIASVDFNIPGDTLKLTLAKK